MRAIPNDGLVYRSEAVRVNTLSHPFTDPVRATPMWGLEPYPGKRYYRHYGLIDARNMAIIVRELGDDTMDLSARTGELMSRRRSRVPREASA